MTTVEVRPVEEEQPSIAVLLTDLDTERRKVTDLEARLQAWQVKWERTWERLNAEANSRGWCSEYDDICEELGGIPRQQPISVTLTATVKYELDEDEVRSVMGLGRFVDINVTDGGYVELQLTFDREVSVAGNECGCEKINWEEEAEHWLEEQSISYSEITDTSAGCANC